MGDRSRQIADSIKRHGLGRTSQDLALRLLNRLVFFRILKCLKIDSVNPEFLECDGRYHGLFLSESALRTFTTKPEYEISAEFLDRAMARGDGCYGFLDGNTLASYGWYSNRPTETDWPALCVQFDEQYIYMYKGFTHLKYRGKRLHSIGMTRALEFYLAKGYKGILSYVESGNVASLKSCYRMGYRDFGEIYAVGLFNRFFLYSSSGCRPYGLKLSRTENPSGEASSYVNEYSGNQRI
jgi:hypothetical protein